MSEEFNIFKNLEDLRKTNLLDQLKSLESARCEELNDSLNLDDDFDFDNLLNNNNNKKVKSPKREFSKAKAETPKKKSKKNAKTRKSSTSTDGSISPTMPILENLSKKVDELPVGRRTRSSLGGSKKTTEKNEIVLESIEPSSSQGRARGRLRGRGRGRGKTRANGNISQELNDSIDLVGNSFGIPIHNSSNEVSTREDESDNTSSSMGIMERFLQQGRQGRSRVMRARRQYVAEVAARSTQVDFIDLVSSPVPRVEGFIELDSDTEENTRTTRSKKRNQEMFSFNTNVNKATTEPGLDISFDEDNPELNIKVNWKGKPEAFKLRKYQKFAIIFKQLADRENITENNIVFNLNDRIIMADDTPDSINYKIFQFIDGRVLSNRFTSPGAVAANAKKRDANKITLKIQSDKWKRPLQIDLMKTDKFRILYIKCAEELKLSLDHLKLSFDGELLELNDTPQDLDMEGGEAIDLRIKN
ncbi:DNA repair protein Rad60 [Cochliomyia hominivorax]